MISTSQEVAFASERDQVRHHESIVFISLGALPWSRGFYIQDDFIQCLFSSQLSQSRQPAITTNQRLGALKSSNFFLIVLWLEVHAQDASASSVRVATVCLHMALPLHMVLPLYLCIVGRREKKGEAEHLDVLLCKDTNVILWAPLWWPHPKLAVSGSKQHYHVES